MKKKSKKGGAPKGSKNAEKFSTPQERKEAYELYCLHLAAGYSGGCFYSPCTEDTINNLKKKYPQDFDVEAERIARARGRMLWEDIGLKGTIGKIKGFNSHSWKFNVQNRLGWKDRVETGLDDDTKTIFTFTMGRDLSGGKEEE